MPADQDEIYHLAGPVPYRSMMPFSLIFPHPQPDTAAVLKRGATDLTWNTQYSSSMVRERKRDEQIQVDGEFMRTSINVKHGIGYNLEMGVELPFLHYSSGVLDDFIEEFHDTFGLAQGRRNKNPDDIYAVNYSAGNHIFHSPSEDRLHLGDIPLYLKATLLDPDRDIFGLAARCLVEFPTGDASRGFGSGELDSGIGVLAQKNFSSSLVGYFNVDHVMRKDPSSLKHLHASHVTHISAAIEKAFTPAFSIVIQSDYQTKPLSNAHLMEFTKPEWAGALGLNWKLSDTFRMRLYFTEGITTHTTSDFILGLTLGKRF